MKYLLHFSLLTLALLSFSGCYREEAIAGQYSDEFYLRHKGADLPVWVRGNRESRSFVIFLHGGPGGSSLYDALARSLRDLSDAHPVVFFDQRLSGYAQGERSIENVNIDLMTEDLDVLVALIREKYNPEHIFLMGHSWGGYLGTAYLANPAYRAHVTGWIEVAGAHNGPLTWREEIKYLTPIAQQKVAEGESDWQELLDWIPLHDSVTNIEELLFVNGFAHRADGKPGAEDAYEAPAPLWLLSSPIGLIPSQKKAIDALGGLLLTDGLSSQMGQITTPTLLLYGEYDAVVPKALGQHAYDKLGTPAADKSLIIMPNEGHSMWAVEPQLFAQHIRDFIARYE